MKIDSTQRGLSEVLGAILVFALVFAVLVIVQTSAVPTANAQVEFEHSTAVEAELGEFGESLDRLAAVGGSESVSIQAGMQYPNRMFLMNPPPVGYTFASGDLVTDGVAVDNVVALDSEADDYLSGEMAYDTQSYTLSTDYNQYRTAPTYHIEGGLLYKQFDNGAVSFVDSGSIVSGRTISLVVIEGDIAEGGTGALALETSAVSGGTESISVTSQTAGTPVTVSLATELSQEAWEELLAPELASSGGYVVDDSIAVSGGVVSFDLVADETYDLRLSKFQFGTETTATPAAAYLTAPEGRDVAVGNGAGALTVEVRDEFHNPLSGVPVTFEVESGSGDFGGAASVTVVTGEAGRATASFDPDGNAAVRATIDDDDTAEPNPKRVDFAVDDLSKTVVTDGSQDTEFINPSATVVLVDSTALGADGVEMEFENRGGSTKTLTEMRVNFYMGAKPGKNGGSPITARVSDDSFATNSTVLEVGGALVDIEDVNFPTSGSTHIDIRFYTDAAGEDVFTPPNTDQFFVVSLVFDDGTSGTYFVENSG